MTDATTAPSQHGAGAGEKGLKGGALGLLATTVIGVASTAPGYSLAATLGFVITVAGFKSAAIMWLAFVPMAFTAAAYYYLNRADPDCGTTFSWVTRAMGPTAGWFGGWAIIVADIIVMAALAQIAGIYTFLLFDADGLAANTFWVTVLGCAFIALVTWICYIGIEVSVRTQYFLLGMELTALGVFAVVALVRVWFGDVHGSVDPSLSWLNPSGIQGFELSWSQLNPFSSTQSDLVIGLLLSIFIYWGWDSAVTVNEESADASRTPGRAAVISTVVLVAIYVIVTVAVQAFAGVDRLADQDDVLAVVGDQVLGSWLGKLLIIAVLTSATASCQTTILPTTRTALSMAAKGAVPKYFARIEPRYLTPSTATIWMGALSILWYAGLTVVSEDALSDSLLSLGLMIAFYYALTAWACVWYYRRHLTEGWRNFVYVGLFPALGGLMLTWVLVKATFVLWEPENSNTGKDWFGIGPPVVIAIVFMILGVVLYGLQRARGTGFFERKAETPTDAVARGDAIAEGALIVEGG